MEQFSLEKYLANPSKKVVTRAGNSVRILCTDRRGDYSIIALVEICDSTEESLYTYTKDGYCGYASSDNDNLFFAPEPHEGWINIYRSEYDDYYKGKVIYSSKEDAIKRGEKTPDYITTTKIEWED